ncbi:MAG: TIGR03790 family protein [Oscillatoriales cyanobacterium C42_A2020_001]|nr:TIGR03790 family protein [Leptolyngbyaceae cyanobacterium C42_A2020_001]
MEPWLTSDELVVLVNQADPLSVQIGEYYQQQRQIPRRNVISVNFVPGRAELSPEEFQQLKEIVDAQVPAYVQAFALTWAEPYRVGCMSITSAFALGFDQAYCAGGCQLTKSNPYFNSRSHQPYQDLRIRPTIAIAAADFNAAKALIDRGMASDNTYPTGTAYLVSTNDKNRNVRAAIYPQIKQYLSSRFNIETINANVLQNKPDVMFYFTGLAEVNELTSNYFLPGAIADHLTSFGGMLTDSSQMSSLRWLEAGATGSYGAVVEPCNFPQKFPNPGIVMTHYLNGDTLLEAYWKSVAMPGQGIFIGEPLARPFATYQ